VEGVPPNTVTDSKSNSYTALNAISNTLSQLFYVSVPTVGSGHTFTAASLVGNLQVEAWSGAASSSPFDVQNATVGTATTVQPGSITPSQNNSLIVTGVGAQNTQTFSINSSFTISDQWGGSGNAVPGAMAYFVQSTAAAINPTWTETGSGVMTATIAAFKPGAATSGPKHRSLGQ